MIEYSNSSLDLLVDIMVAWVQNKLVKLKLPQLSRLTRTSFSQAC